jgi:hypothetical protein
VVFGSNNTCVDSLILAASVATASSPTTLTFKTLDAEGLGNSLSLPTKAFFAAAGCFSSTGSSNWDLPSNNSPNPACQGTNSSKGVLQFARGNAAYINFELPLDWNPSAKFDLKIAFTTADNASGDVTAWDIQTGCNATDGSMTDDPPLGAVQTVSIAIGSGSSAVINGQYVAAQTLTSLSSCQAGYNLVLQIKRNNSGTDTNADLAVAAKWVELTFGRTMNGQKR